MTIEKSKKFHLYSLMVLSLLFYSLCSPAAAGATDSSRILSFGIVPQQSATKLARTWTPILTFLSSRTGYRIDFKTAKDIPTFEKRCAAGEYDIAYMNPYHYTVFHESPGYRVFAKQKLKALKGIIVVREDSPYKELPGLAGKALAFPSPAAFAATIVTSAQLSGLGIDITPVYVSSHDSVYRSVAKGLYPAGGGVPRTFNSLEPSIKDQLKILWTSKGFTPHAIAAHPRVPVDAVKIIADVMAEMEHDPEGKELLKQIDFNGLVNAEDSEWDDVRSLGLDVLRQ